MRLVLCVNPQAPQESPTKDVPAGGVSSWGQLVEGAGKFLENSADLLSGFPLLFPLAKISL